MMNYVIREALSSDAQDIYEINRAEMGYDFPPDKTAENLAIRLRSDTDKILVAVADGRVVGYIHAVNYEALYMEPLKNIMALAVLSDYHRMGVGASLLKAVELWAKESGAVGVRINSGSTRIGAHKFYRSQGYTNEKTQQRFLKIL